MKNRGILRTKISLLNIIKQKVSVFIGALRKRFLGMKKNFGKLKWEYITTLERIEKNIKIVVTYMNS